MKALIVDDELVVRIGLKSMVNWEEAGFDWVGEAENGARALEIIKRMPIDIVLTDIKMPQVDGIELIRAIAQMDKRPEVIVLSCYDDFELVRSAMRLGARDYLRKLQMEPDALLGVLHEIALERLGSPIQRTAEPPVVPDADSVAGAVRRLTQSRNQYALLHVREVGAGAAGEEAERRSVMMNVLESMARETFKSYDCVLEQTGEGDWLLLISQKNEAGAISEAALSRACASLINMAQQYLGVTFYVGVGAPRRGAPNDALDEVKRALYYAVLFEERLCCASQLGELCHFMGEGAERLKVVGLNELGLALAEQFARRDYDEAQAMFERACALAESDGGAGTAWHIAVECACVAAWAALKQGEEPPRLITSLPAREDEKACGQWLERFQCEVLTLLLERSCDLPHPIKLALQYIDKNFQNALSLQAVAETVRLNPTYFSSAFSQSVGMSFTAYLSRLRVAKAKELLKDTNYKVYEIAYAVGYSNAYYFDRIFKKETGMTPNEYRARLTPT